MFVSFKSVTHLFVALVIPLSLTFCKPAGIGSELAAIVGTDEDGKKVALALLPVSRPINVDAAESWRRFGVKDMDRLVRQPAFAFVECVSGKHWSGRIFDEEQWIDGLEDLALQNRLFLNTSGDLKVYQKGDWRGVPCKVRGERLVTFPIIEMMQERLSVLPATVARQSVDFDLYESHVLMAQYLHLALRGSYNPSQAADPRSTALLSMMMAVGEAHYQQPLVGSEQVKANWRKYDGAFVPCFKGTDQSGLPPWAKSIAQASFGCREIKSKKGWFNFLPGGERSYVAMRAKILEAITVEHLGLNGRTIADAQSSGDHAVQLWDLVTRGYPIKDASFAPNLVKYLVANDASLKSSKSDSGFALQDGGVIAQGSGAAPTQGTAVFQPDTYGGGATPGFDVKEYPKALQVPPPSVTNSMFNYNANQNVLQPNYIERSEAPAATIAPVRQQPNLNGPAQNVAQSPFTFNWDRRESGAAVENYFSQNQSPASRTAISEAQGRTAQGFATGQSMYFPLPDANKAPDLYKQSVIANYTRSMDMVTGLDSPKSVSDQQVKDLSGYYQSRTGNALSGSSWTARQELKDVFGKDAWVNEQAVYPELANLPPQQLTQRRNELAARQEQERKVGSIGAFTGNSSTFNPYAEDYKAATARGVKNPLNTAQVIPVPGAGIVANRLVGGGLPMGLNNMPGALNQHLAYPGSSGQFGADKETMRKYDNWQNSPAARSIDERAAQARAERSRNYNSALDAYNRQNPYNPQISHPGFNQ